MEMGRAGWPPASEGVRQAAPALVVGALNGWTELDGGMAVIGLRLQDPSPSGWRRAPRLSS